MNARPVDELTRCAVATYDARGPVPGAPSLDIDGSIRIVAANRAHAYRVYSGSCTWWIPIGDLMTLAQ